LDPDRRRALSDFYREEFQRHLEQLEQNDLAGGDPDSKAVLDQARRTVLADLDRVCWREHFPALAETLLQNFDTLSRLSQVDPRQRH
jgi:hypothetical protein